MTTLTVLAYWTVLGAFIVCLALVVYAVWGHHLDRLLSKDERPVKDECDAKLKLAPTTRYRR